MTGAATPLDDLVRHALEKMASGEWRLLLDHPDPTQGSASYGKEVGREIARLSALTASASEPAPLPDDLFSHRDAWRRGLVILRDTAECDPPIDDKAYWQHELDVFDRVFATLQASTVPASEPEPVALDAFPVVTLDHLSDGAAAVIKERLRQVYGEGWTPEHDDDHSRGELAAAAANYALYGTEFGHDLPNHIWPWSPAWWKPGDRRRDLVKAGALIIAEIERLDRGAAKPEGE